MTHDIDWRHVKELLQPLKGLRGVASVHEVFIRVRPGVVLLLLRRAPTGRHLRVLRTNAQSVVDVHFEQLGVSCQGVEIR